MAEGGVTASYSFGPILVEDGQVCPDVDKHRVKMENPRCGVGLIEPGHFLVIVSDGRDARRAYGYTLREFAQIFVEFSVFSTSVPSTVTAMLWPTFLNWTTPLVVDSSLQMGAL